MSNDDYFAAPNPLAYSAPTPLMWTYQPPPRSRAANTAGQVVAGVAGFVFFVTVVVPTAIAMFIGVGMLLGPGVTF